MFACLSLVMQLQLTLTIQQTNQRCDSQNLYIVGCLSVAYYVNRKNNPFSNIIAHSLKPHPRKMPHATRRISSACFDVYDAFTSAYTTLSVIPFIAVKNEQK